jgi:hypothetical protein
MTTQQLTGLRINPGRIGPDGAHVIVMTLFNSHGDPSGQIVMSEDAAAQFAKTLLDTLSVVRTLNKGHADA